MNLLKARRVLTTLHLWIAGLLAPAFLVVAISGGLYIAGIEANVERTPITLAQDTELAFGTDALEGQVRNLIEEQGLPVDFEYIRGGPNRAQTRPTTRTFLTLQQTPDGLEAALNKPNFQSILLELHKGHGPRAYRLYEIAVALALFLAVLGGIAVGLLAKAYRRPTLIAVSAGTALAVILATL